MLAALADFGPVLIVELLLLGVMAGFMAGMLGIGGGMLLVPFMTLLLDHQGVPAAQAVKMGIASSGATILFTSLSSLRAHHAHGAVRWPIVRQLSPGILVGGVIAGTAVMAQLKGQWMALIFAAFNTFMAWRMWSSPPGQAGRAWPGGATVAATGAGIGFISALVGAGGAFLSVPFMTRHGVHLREAVGTSAAIGFPVALGATAGAVIAGLDVPASVPGTIGYLYVPGILVIALASVLLAPVGARAAQRLPVQALKRVFALMLLALAFYVAGRSIWAG